MDELEKIGAAGRLRFGHKLTKQLGSRLGRRFREKTRPMRVTNFLKTTFKQAEYSPAERTGFTASKRRKDSDVPSREEMDNDETAFKKREDGRSNAATVYGPTTVTNLIGG